MTIHVGLIGGGNISETHARAARAIPGVSIVAAYGTNAEKVERLCREHGGQAYRDFAAFLAHRPMDLVMIGSPSGLHATQGIAAAQRGLHVLTEKPIDVTTKGADALIEAAKQSKVKLGVIFQDRMKPDIRKLKQWVDRRRSWQASSDRRAREMVSPAGILRGLQVARELGAGRRRRADEPGRAHRRSPALVAGRCGSRSGAHGHRAARHRSRGHRRRHPGVCRRRSLHVA